MTDPGCRKLSITSLQFGLPVRLRSRIRLHRGAGGAREAQALMWSRLFYDRKSPGTDNAMSKALCFVCECSNSVRRGLPTAPLATSPSSAFLRGSPRGVSPAGKHALETGVVAPDEQGANNLGKFQNPVVLPVVRISH